MTSDGGNTELVVVGVDGSSESVAALGWAARYSAATGSRVRAVMTWHYQPAVGTTPAGRAPATVTDEVRQAMQETLANAVTEACAALSSDAVETQIAYGHPAQVLIDQSRDADLLVVGSRGHGAFTGMTVGSVSIHCVTHAECPVVVVRGEA
jgi:nucleotide-binding universal stress UspA family protein